MAMSGRIQSWSHGDEWVTVVGEVMVAFFGHRMIIENPDRPVVCCRRACSNIWGAEEWLDLLICNLKGMFWADATGHSESMIC